MSKTSRLSLLAGAAIAFGSAGSALAESEAVNNEDQVRSIVAEMLADAESRSSLLQSGGSAGHDGSQFFLSSGDGAFRLNVSGQIQFRYYLNFRDDDNNSDRNGDGDVDEIDDELNPETDFESGFQTRRTKLTFEGNVFEESLFYHVTGAFDRDGGDFELEDAYVGYEFDNGIAVRWGQFKVPFMREELVSSKRQLAVDRSLTNEVFNQGRSQGVELAYEAEDAKWRTAVAFSDGFNSVNSDITTEKGLAPGFRLGGGEAQYAFTGRFEFLGAGNWSQFNDFTSQPGSDFGLLVGAAVHFEGGDEDGNAYGGDDYFNFSYTVDVSVEGDGWNAFAAFVGSTTELDDVPADGPGADADDVDNDDFGFVVQGGWQLPNTDWELFGRYDILFPDDGDRRESDDEFQTITFGTNYYLHGHAAKFTADIQWHIDDTNEISGPNTGIGYLQDDDDGEFAFRFQFQLLF